MRPPNSAKARSDPFCRPSLLLTACAVTQSSPTGPHRSRNDSMVLRYFLFRITICGSFGHKEHPFAGEAGGATTGGGGFVIINGGKEFVKIIGGGTQITGETWPLGLLI